MLLLVQSTSTVKCCCTVVVVATANYLPAHASAHGAKTCNANIKIHHKPKNYKEQEKMLHQSYNILYKCKYF